MVVAMVPLGFGWAQRAARSPDDKNYASDPNIGRGVTFGKCYGKKSRPMFRLIRYLIRYSAFNFESYYFITPEHPD